VLPVCRYDAKIAMDLSFGFSAHSADILGRRLAGGLLSFMPVARPAEVQEILLDDVRLVRRMAAGEAAALGSFYDRWSGQLYATVIAIVRSAQDAEEIVDDCFWQAWNQADRFDPARGQVRSWILNIARSRALDRLKAIKRRREEELDSAPASSLAAASSTEEQIDEAARATQVAFAMKILPVEQRAVIEMVYYGGLTQSEVSASTGEPLGTVKTRIRLGMQKLRATLGTMERSSS